MRRIVCLAALSALLTLAGALPTAATAAERLRAVDGADASATADLREVRVTSDGRVLTIVVRFAAVLPASGPPVEVQLGAAPQGFGIGCAPRPSGATTVQLRAASAPQRALAESGGRAARPIVWAGVDARELVVYVPPAAAGSGAIGCISAGAFGEVADMLGAAIPQAGAWPLLSGPSEDPRTGRLAVGVSSKVPPVQVRFQTAVYRGVTSVFVPTGPYMPFTAPFDGTVMDATPRRPGQQLVWRALAANGDGTGYSLPRLARFDDIAAPTIRLRRPAAARGGSRVPIRGEVADDSRRASVILEVREGSRVLGRVGRPVGQLPAGTATLGRIPTPAHAGRLVVCGVAVDGAGNRSERSCTDVVLRAPSS